MSGPPRLGRDKMRVWRDPAGYWWVACSCGINSTAPTWREAMGNVAIYRALHGL